MVGRLRRLGDCVHGGSRLVARSREAALPMVVRNAAVCLETSRRALSSRARRPRMGRLSVRLAFSAHLPRAVACGRPALRLESDLLLARARAARYDVRTHEPARADDAVRNFSSHRLDWLPARVLPRVR